MAMNYASAITMNNLVLALDQTEKTVDIALASQEYALSNNTVERNLQLLYGLSAIKSQNFNMVLDVLICFSVFFS
jgi:negative regulator of replication initiation